ncbi:MAG: winged helix DNA-binding domain-containing protein [Bryobacteraceae bacterium]|nr:winged helix DNA-binding domain-containing protein [Bryobacteraceae bacterium]
MDAKLAAWWWRRQGFDSPLREATPAAVLERTGWARSVGGCGPYLTMWSRGGFSRARMDEAAARQEIQELPSARGCTYVLPASDFALGLAAGAGPPGDYQVILKLGVTEREIARLCDAVENALAAGPLDPDEIRERAGKLVRNLGEAGKKKGVTTTLPVALGMLQSQGRIRRIPVNGRLDQQRYRYAAWNLQPLDLPAEEIARELARRYLAWTAPASLDEFRWFSGLGVKAAKAAFAALDLSWVGDRAMPAEDRDEFERYRAPAEPRYALVSSLDGLTLLRRSFTELLNPAGSILPFLPAGKSRIADPPSHLIIDRGRVCGLWEFDARSNSIAWGQFGRKDPALAAEVARTEAFIRDELGDARSFSLDSPRSREPRIEALRAL